MMVFSMEMLTLGEYTLQLVGTSLVAFFFPSSMLCCDFTPYASLPACNFLHNLFCLKTAVTKGMGH